MINKHKKMYSCPVCNRNTVTLHEIFYGTSNRKISIEYNLQVPLCPICHYVSHTRELLNGYSPLTEFRTIEGLNKVMIQTELCRHLGIDRDKTSLAVNTNDTEYLESISGECEKKIKSWEIT